MRHRLAHGDRYKNLDPITVTQYNSGIYPLFILKVKLYFYRSFFIEHYRPDRW